MQAFDGKADVAHFKSGSGCEWLTLQILPTYCKQQTCRAVNTAMLQTYWQVGQRIVEEEQQGQALISKLSRYLGDQFGQGFSVANLKNFRPFSRIRYAVRSESLLLHAKNNTTTMPEFARNGGTE